MAKLRRTAWSRAERSASRTVTLADIEVLSRDKLGGSVEFRLPGFDRTLSPTHWSFGQIAGFAGAPPSYLRSLPPALAAENLRHGLADAPDQQVRTLELSGASPVLRAVTGPGYGRIFDHELVEAVQKIAGDGVRDSRWKIPGVLDWSTHVYNPLAPVTKESTTLYASDRDVFLFLVDDLNPIEAGKLPNGDPDLFFRGFYCWNSEVGARTLGIATFYLRAVCQNRNLWGVEGFNEITVRHSRFAPDRFASEIEPALRRLGEASPRAFIEGMAAARARIVASTDEERIGFLRERGFSKAETGAILETVWIEEGHSATSAFDFAQGVTALARSRPHQDARIALETRAHAILTVH